MSEMTSRRVHWFDVDVVGTISIPTHPVAELQTDLLCNQPQKMYKEFDRDQHCHPKDNGVVNGADAEGGIDTPKGEREACAGSVIHRGVSSDQKGGSRGRIDE